MSINVEVSRAVHPCDATGFSGVGVADKTLSGNRDDTEQAMVVDDFVEGAAEGLVKCGSVEDACADSSCDVEVEDLFSEPSG